MKINRNELVRVLQAIAPGLARKEVIEQSTSFIFNNNVVLTYNDEVACSHPVKLDLECAVQAKELLALLNKLTDEEVDVSVDEKQGKFIVKGKKNKAGIKLEMKTNVDEILAVLGKAKKWDTLPATFIEALSFCLFSAGRDMTKALLTCVHCCGNIVMAGDDIRITVFDMGKKADMESLNIPASAVPALKAFEPLEYTTTNGWAHFRTKEGVMFSCRVIEDAYPREKTLGFVEKTAKGERIALPEGLREALERAGIFSAGNDIKTITDDRVHIEIEDGVMLIRGEGNVGYFEEESRVRYKGDLIEFDVNPTFLNTILSHTDEMVISQRRLRFEGENFTHVIITMAPKKDR